MQDGSDDIVRLARAQRAAHVASGAPWVAVHHGGGVGMGKSIHSGAQILADGTADGALRLERVLTHDPGTGVVRRADAGYDFARRTAREGGIDCRCCELAAARPDRPAGVLSTRHRRPTRPSCSATAGWSGPVRPHRQPRAMRCCTWTARASCRGSSTATPTWSSAATGPRSSRPASPALRTPRGWHPQHRVGDPGDLDRGPDRPRGAPGAGGLRSGTTTIEVKSTA